MKIVILDRDAMGKDLPLDKIRSLGEVTVYDSTAGEEVAERIRTAEAVILNKVRITEDDLRAAGNLRLICVFATGYDNIDTSAARACGVTVCNVPGYSTDSVVLFTVATALSLVARLPEYNRFVRSGEYSRSGVPNRLTPPYREVRGMCWGIIGAGHIGRAVGTVAESLGARVLYYKRHPASDINCVSFRELCRESDIITVHCPLNEDSRGMIGEEALRLMKPGTVLVNEARGAVLDEAAVAAAVESGHLGGFGTDVYSEEPLPLSHPFYALRDRTNVLLTPHAAWGAYEARVRCMDKIKENIDAFLSGHPKNVVN